MHNIICSNNSYIQVCQNKKTKKSPKDMVVVLELMGKSLALALAFGRHEKQYWHSRHFQGDPAL